jgi:hypothetical protein
MDRRGFLKRLTVVMTGVGLTAVAPQVVQAVEPPPPAPPALTPAALEEAFEAVKPIYDVEHWQYATSSTFTLNPPVQPGRAPVRSLKALGSYERTQVLRNSLAKLSSMGDDAFLPGDEEVQWRWEQVRKTVIGGYPGNDDAGYIKRIIALPAVADALFGVGEPGFLEWQGVRRTFYRMADKALEI